LIVLIFHFLQPIDGSSSSLSSDSMEASADSAAARDGVFAVSAYLGNLTIVLVLPFSRFAGPGSLLRGDAKGEKTASSDGKGEQSDKTEKSEQSEPIQNEKNEGESNGSSKVKSELQGGDNEHSDTHASAEQNAETTEAHAAVCSGSCVYTNDLQFAASALPPNTTEFWFPTDATATTAVGSQFRYVSRMKYSRGSKSMEISVGQLVSFTPQHRKDARTARVGAIPVKVRAAAKPTHEARLDLEVVVKDQGRCHVVKPSLLSAPADQPSSPALPRIEAHDLTRDTRIWVFETHVRAAAERARRKTEAAALKHERETRTHAPAAPVLSPTAAASLAPLLSPLTESVTTMQRQQAELLQRLAATETSVSALTRGVSASQAPASSSTALAPLSPRSVSFASPALPPSSPSTALPYLAEALRYSQLSAMNLAQSYFVAAGLPTASAAASFSPPLLLMPPVAQPSIAAAPAAASPAATDAEVKPSHPKRRRIRR
jgi:hypothetical protein